MAKVRAVATERDSRPIIIVTGGTAGLGRLVVERLTGTAKVEEIVQLLRSDYQVMRVGRRAMPAEQHVINVVADAAFPQRYADTIVNAVGNRQVACVINCAAINLFQDLETWNTIEEDMLRVYTVNVVSGAVLVRTLLPHLAPQATIINVGSRASGSAGRSAMAYVASKHALLGVTRSLIKDLPGYLITQVDPPTLAGTEMSDYIRDNRKEPPSSTPMSAEDMAEYIVNVYIYALRNRSLGARYEP